MERYNIKTGGFTLVEVMIAIAIFSIGILAVAGMQTDASRLNRTAMLQTMAANVASEAMEDYFNYGRTDYDDPVLREGIPFTVQVDYTPGVDVPGENGPETIAEAGIVTVSVAYDAPGGERRIEFKSIVADI